MKQLAIKGHLTRFKEVINLLEMLGGKNIDGYIGIDIDELYMIEDSVIIQAYDWNNCIIFTLEEFEEKYPYKVGDKVTLDNKLCTVIWMCWECNNIYYQVQGIDTMFTKKVTANELKPCKEQEDMEEPKELLIGFTKDSEGDWIINTHKNYEIKEVNGKFKLIKKKSKYPKTYEECTELLGCDDKIKMSIIGEFTRLINARNAYWKIAGEQMGLDKPWKPTTETVYCISRNDNVIKCSYRGGKSNILEFPTKEMRDTFYENFTDLIEQCKELL